MKNKLAQGNGSFYPKQSCLFYGQFVALEGKAYMVWISSGQLMSVVEEANQSLLVLYIPYLRDCADGVMLNPEKGMLWEVEQSDNITFLPTLVSQFLSQLTSFSQCSSIGNQKSKSDSLDVLSRVLKNSLIIKWLTYPMSNFMDKDDKARFAEYLVWRDVNLDSYNKRYLFFLDIFQFLNMLLGYVLDKIERVLSVRLNLKQ